MKVSLIVAVGKQGQIGKDNKLLWHIPDDLKNFKKITLNHPIIMGRKTYESIGKPLPNRTNIVLSSKKIDQVLTATSLEGALQFAKTLDTQEVFVIGGASVYKEAVDKKFIDRIYLSLVEYDQDADTFFKFDQSQFKCVSEEKFPQFVFQVWDRI